MWIIEGLGVQILVGTSWTRTVTKYVIHKTKTNVSHRTIKNDLVWDPICDDMLRTEIPVRTGPLMPLASIISDFYKKLDDMIQDVIKDDQLIEELAEPLARIRKNPQDRQAAEKIASTITRKELFTKIGYNAHDMEWLAENRDFLIILQVRFSGRMRLIHPEKNFQPSMNQHGK